MTISLSANAKKRVLSLLSNKERPENLYLRVYVSGGGCSGFQYGFTFDDCKNEDDFLLTEDQVSVLVDSMSAQFLEGAKIDFKNDLQGSRFSIDNPNASSTCGCGSSFSLE